jgi:hypothetical protein
MTLLARPNTTPADGMLTVPGHCIVTLPATGPSRNQKRRSVSLVPACPNTDAVEWTSVSTHW